MDLKRASLQLLLEQQQNIHAEIVRRVEHMELVVAEMAGEIDRIDENRGKVTPIAALRIAR